MANHIWATPDEFPEFPMDFVCDDGHPWQGHGHKLLVNVFHAQYRIEQEAPFDYVCTVCGERTNRSKS